MPIKEAIMKKLPEQLGVPEEKVVAFGVLPAQRGLEEKNSEIFPLLTFMETMALQPDIKNAHDEAWVPMADIVNGRNLTHEGQQMDIAANTKAILNKFRIHAMVRGDYGGDGSIRKIGRMMNLMLANRGGIDLTSDKALTVQNNGQAIKFHIEPAMLKALEDARLYAGYYAYGTDGEYSCMAWSMTKAPLIV